MSTIRFRPFALSIRPPAAREWADRLLLHAAGVVDGAKPLRGTRHGLDDRADVTIFGF